MTGLVDLHCHLLPGLDDGPVDDAAAVALARALIADGVTTVAATPHQTIRLRTPSLELDQRMAALRALLEREGVPLTVVSGAEISVELAMDLDKTDIANLRLAGHGPLLIELPQREVVGDPSWPVRELLEAGVPVLLAHPERIPFLRGGPERLQDLRARGARTQLTSGALLGRYGSEAQAVAIAMLRGGQIDVLASDAHHATLRPPETQAALAWIATAHPEIDREALAVHTPAMLISPPQHAAR